MWSKNKTGGQIGRKLASLRRWITGLRFVALSLAFGILVWVIDAILDFFIFYKGEETFFELLVSDMPRHEVYIRSVILGCFLVFGIIISKAWAGRERVEEGLRKANRALKVLSECNQTVVRATEESRLLHDICQIIVEIGEYRLAWVGFAEQDEAKTVRPVAQVGFEDGYLETVDITWADTERGRGPTGTAIRTGKPSIARDIQTEPHYAPWRTEATRRGYTSSIALPLISEGLTLGALNIYAIEPDAFDAEEVKLLTELAGDLAFGIMVIRTRAEREQAEEVLQYQAYLLENVSDAIISFDMAEYRIVSWNQAAEALYGWRADEVMGKPTGKVIRAEYPHNLEGEALDQFLEKGVWEGQVIHRRKDGTAIDILITVSQIKDNDGNPVGAVAVNRDITERKRAEEELRKYHEHLEELVEERTAELAVAMKRAEEADKLKSAFLATMSHELRTPLNSIIGFTGIILQGLVGPLNDEQTKQLGMVRNSAHHLLDLINDVLDISKIEAGQVEIVAKPFDMREVVEKVVRTVTSQAEKKGLTLVAEVTPEVGEITSDRRRVEQILLNLLNNAVKFTEKGEVRVECQVNDDYLVTHVVDTGIGIKPEDMGNLFEAFQQVESGLTRRHEGTGLGLSICKKLVEMLGGEIWAESKWGVGSTFTFTLPIRD